MWHKRVFRLNKKASSNRPYGFALFTRTDKDLILWPGLVLLCPRFRVSSRTVLPFVKLFEVVLAHGLLMRM